ncbi:MAG: hypothetical protein K1X55_10855 [Chitinophagales bacterium]|nr:hypothetical protein [Chitinophagales bacterium]
MVVLFGKSKAILINLVFILIFFITAGYHTYCILDMVNRTELTALVQNGVLLNGYINKFGYEGKGGEQAFVKYSFDNKKYNESFPRKDTYTKGDSLALIVLPANPNIVMLTSEYYEAILDDGE